MSLIYRYDTLDDIPVLLPHGGNCGQDFFRKEVAAIALIVEASLLLQDRPAQGSLGPIVVASPMKGG